MIVMGRRGEHETYLDASEVARVLVASVGDGDDVGGLKDTAVVAGLVGRVLVAVFLVNGGEEVTEDVVVASTLDLEKGGLLRVDDGVDHVKVEVGFAAGVVGAVGCGSSVDEV